MAKKLSVATIVILLTLCSLPAAAKISSGRYEIAPGALVSRQGGLVGDESVHWLTGEIELFVSSDGREVRISQAKLQVYGWWQPSPFPSPADLQLTSLIGSVEGDHLLFTEPANIQLQQAQLTLDEDDDGLLLDGSYNEGCCDRYVYTFESVRLLAIDPALLGLYLPGVAHISGEQGASWRSDVTLFNPTDQTMEVLITFTSEEVPPVEGQLQLELIGLETRVVRDVVATMLTKTLGTTLGKIDAKGYLRITSDGTTNPVIAAKTYHDSEDGSFGQALVPFGRERLIEKGEKVYLTGVEGSAVDSEGSRSNLGLLNVSPTESTEVLVVLDTTMGGITRASTYSLAPGQFIQSNLLRDLGLGNATGVYSVRIEVSQGGPVAAYISVIDNLSQDPLLLTNGLTAP